MQFPRLLALAASRATTTTTTITPSPVAALRLLLPAFTSFGKSQTARSIATVPSQENVSERVPIPANTNTTSWKLPPQETISKPTSVVAANLQAATEAETKAAIAKLREQGKFYAVVDIIGRSYLVAPRDIVYIQYCREANVGDVISFDQVREIGSKDFTIRGQPYVSPDYFTIKGTVLEKPLGKDKVTLKFKRRKGYRRRRVFNEKFTTLRISEIDVKNI